MHTYSVCVCVCSFMTLYIPHIYGFLQRSKSIIGLLESEITDSCEPWVLGPGITEF